MPNGKPPFRADHVGSLLRPVPLREARAAQAPDLRAIEDRCIAEAIAAQRSVGLRAVTDGEYRRAFWHFDFLARLGGVEMYEADQGIQFKGGQTKAYGLKV
ncbi:MAG: 5-methyltetrahydropteroyltriglutamate--homocysteine S-methyltransferase, partial [Paracraurococcus sp.]